MAAIHFSSGTADADGEASGIEASHRADRQRILPRDRRGTVRQGIAICLLRFSQRHRPGEQREQYLCDRPRAGPLHAGYEALPGRRHVPVGRAVVRPLPYSPAARRWSPTCGTAMPAIFSREATARALKAHFSRPDGQHMVHEVCAEAVRLRTAGKRDYIRWAEDEIDVRIRA